MEIPDANDRALAEADESVSIETDREDPIAESVCRAMSPSIFLLLEAANVKLMSCPPFSCSWYLFPNPDRPVVATGDNCFDIRAVIRYHVKRSHEVGVALEAHNVHLSVNVMDLC